MTGRKIAWLIIAAALIMTACAALIIGLTRDNGTHAHSAKFVCGVEMHKSGATETNYRQTGLLRL